LSSNLVQAIRDAPRPDRKQPLVHFKLRFTGARQTGTSTSGATRTTTLSIEVSPALNQTGGRMRQLREFYL
jgi:hypothetical protein